MADHGVGGPGLGPAAHRILDGWLDRLGGALPARSRLRARIVDELRDGLLSAAERRVDGGLDPVRAARAAVAEFGDPDTVAASFRGELTARAARRTGLALLVSGPLVGLAWLGAIVPPLWPPRPVDLLGAHPLFVVALAVAVPAALLAVAATGPLGRRLPGHRPPAVLAAAAAIACAVGDGLLLVGLLGAALAAPVVPGWPVGALATALSLARLGLAAVAAHRCLRAPGGTPRTPA